MGDQFSGWNAVAQMPVAQPPAQAPAIASLGNLIDLMTQRRLELARVQNQQAQEDRLQTQQEGKDAYFRRKMDLAEKKQGDKDAFDRAKYNQGLQAEISKKIGRGETPGAYLFMDANGRPAMVTPRFVPHETPVGELPDPFENQQAQPDPIDRALGPSGVIPRTDYSDLLDSARPAAMRTTEPGGEQVDPEADSDSERGLDEPDPDPAGTEARRQRMLQADPGGPVDLTKPIHPAQPGPRPGLMPADQVQPFLRGVGVPPIAPQQPQPGGLSSHDIMLAALSDRQRQLGGDMEPTPQAQPQPQKRGKWVYDVPGVGSVEVDLDQARQAHSEEIQGKLAQIDAAMADPELAMDPATMSRLRQQRILLQSDLPPADRAALAKATETRSNLELTESGKADRQQVGIESREKIAQGKNETALEVARLRAKRRLGAADKATAMDGGTAFSQLGQKMANQTRRSVDMSMDRDMRHMNWDKLEGSGIDRLNLAQMNATASGPFAGTQNFEAMMNFFGYIRGGVPAKNETDEWRRTTSNLTTTLDSIGSYFGSNGLGQRLLNGDPNAGGELEALNSRMSPEQRASLIRAIKESKASVVRSGDKNLDSMAEKFTEASTLPERELAQGRLNTMRRFLGLSPKQFFDDVPLRTSASGAPAASAPQSAPGAPPSGGGTSIRDLLFGGQ